MNGQTDQWNRTESTETENRPTKYIWNFQHMIDTWGSISNHWDGLFNKQCRDNWVVTHKKIKLYSYFI